MAKSPSLSVVVPTHNTRGLTLSCLAAVLAMAGDGFETILVDDASTDGTAEAVAAAYGDAVHVLRMAHQSGFSEAVNAGAECCAGELLLLLNSDTTVPEEAAQLVRRRFANSPELGILGAQLLNPDGSLQWSGGRWPSVPWLFALASGVPAAASWIPGYRRLKPLASSTPQAPDWVSGAAMVVRRELWHEIGPFDGRYEFYCQDMDLCRMARDAGWEVDLLRDLHVVHHHGATIRRQSGAATVDNPGKLWPDVLRFVAKHEGWRASREAYRALDFGSTLRVTMRRLARPFIGIKRRSEWIATSETYRAARQRLAEVRDELERTDRVLS